jgi:hypothetical protein
MKIKFLLSDNVDICPSTTDDACFDSQLRELEMHKKNIFSNKKVSEHKYF